MYNLVGLISRDNKVNLYTLTFFKIIDIPGDVNFAGFIRNLYISNKKYKNCLHKSINSLVFLSSFLCLLSIFAYSVMITYSFRHIAILTGHLCILSSLRAMKYRRTCDRKRSVYQENVGTVDASNYFSLLW